MKGKKWLLGFLAGTILAFLIMIMRGIFSAQTLAQRLLCVCDGFSVSGLLFLCFGAMLWIAGEGSFDILGYAVRKGLHHILPGGSMENIGSYYDYKMSKTEKKTPDSHRVLLCILTVGAVFLVLGIVLIVIWENIAG